MRHLMAFFLIIGACATDHDGDGYSQECNDDDPAVFPDAAELCDGLDNNCDGQTDEGWFDDADSDEYGTGTLTDCAIATNAAGGDCVDSDASVHPGAGEQCDGVDDDCNDAIDDGLPTLTFWPDADEDGFGSTNAPTPLCGPAAGYVANDLDCDDTNPEAYTGHDEWCDHADNDCDGIPDNHPVVGYLSYVSWPDVDEDGGGDASVAPTIECTIPQGYVLNGLDCDDADPEVPIAYEPYCDDGKDNDCDGYIDIYDDECQ